MKKTIKSQPKENTYKELNTDFLMCQLEQYHQKWLSGLMDTKVEFLFRDTVSEGNLTIFTYTYNVYCDDVLYQVVATHEGLLHARRLYTQIVKRKNEITYQQVNEENAKINKETLVKIESLLNRSC